MWLRRALAVFIIFATSAVVGGGIAYASSTSDMTYFGPIKGYSYGHRSTFVTGQSKPTGVMYTYETTSKKWPSNWVTQRVEILKNNAVCSAGNDAIAPSSNGFNSGSNGGYCGAGNYSARGVTGAYNGTGMSYYYAGQTQSFYFN